MRRLVALWLLLAAPAFADRPNEVGFTVQDWCGLNTYNDSARIADCDAQDAENVLTDRGFLEKRTGAVRQIEILSGAAAKDLRQYVATSGTRYAIAHASGNVYSSDLGSTPTAIGTVTATGNVDAVTAFTNLYVTDGSANLIQWNGTSSTTISAAPICTLIEFAHERLWCANIPAESSSRVRISSFGSSGYWTIPANVSEIPDGPNSFDFQKDDGEGIVCMTKTPWGVVFGKRHSMHAVKGFDNETWKKIVIDPSIGCVDDRTMQMLEGELVWLSLDGVYKWRGAGPPVWISRDIESITKSIRQLNSVAGEWIVDSEGDWERGTVLANGPTGSWDTNSIPGTIFPASFTFRATSGEDFLLGSLGLASAAVDIDTITVSGGAITIAKSTTSSYNFDPFTDANITSSPTWTTSDSCMTTASKDGSQRLVCDCSSCAGGTMTTPSTATYGRWAFDYLIPTGESSCGTGSNDLQIARYEFLSGGPIIYSMRIYCTATANQVTYRFYRDETQVGASKTLNITPGTATTFSAVRTSTGAFSIYFGTATELSATYDDSPAPTQVKIFAYRYNATAESNSFDNISIPEFKTAVVAYSPVFDTAISTPLGGPITVSSTITGGIGTLSFQIRSATSASGEWLAWANMTNEVSKSTQARRYQQLLSSFTTTSSTIAPSIREWVTHVVATGTYRAEVKNIGTRITQWRAWDWSDTSSPNNILQFFVRAASYSFVGSENLVTWSSMANHTTISIATNSNVQFYVDSGSMTSSSQTAPMTRSAAHWQEGSEKPAASAVFDHRYYLCVTLSSTSLINDTCLVYQKNGKWTKLTGPKYASLLLFGSDLLAGGADSGYLWKLAQEGVYNDDGAAISAFWTGKDFMFGPNGRDWATGEKSLSEFWVDADVSSRTIVNVGYAVNKSTTYANGTLNLGAWGDMVNKQVFFDSGYGLGKYFRPKFSNSQNDQPMRVNAFTLYGEPKMRGD